MKVVNYTAAELRVLPILERLLIREALRLKGKLIEIPKAHRPGYHDTARVEIDRDRVHKRRDQVISFLRNRKDPATLTEIAGDMCASPSTAKVYCHQLLKEGVIGRSKEYTTGKYFWRYTGGENDT